MDLFSNVMDGGARKKKRSVSPWLRHVRKYMKKHNVDFSTALAKAKRSYRKKGSKSKSRKSRKSCKKMSRKTCKRSRKCSWNRNRKGSRKHKAYCSKKRSGNKKSRKSRKSKSRKSFRCKRGVRTCKCVKPSTARKQLKRLRSKKSKSNTNQNKKYENADEALQMRITNALEDFTGELNFYTKHFGNLKFNHTVETYLNNGQFGPMTLKLAKNALNKVMKATDKKLNQKPRSEKKAAAPASDDFMKQRVVQTTDVNELIASV